VWLGISTWPHAVLVVFGSDRLLASLAVPTTLLPFFFPSDIYPTASPDGKSNPPASA